MSRTLAEGVRLTYSEKGRSSGVYPASIAGAPSDKAGPCGVDTGQLAFVGGDQQFRYVANAYQGCVSCTFQREDKESLAHRRAKQELYSKSAHRHCWNSLSLSPERRPPSDVGWTVRKWQPVQTSVNADSAV